MKNVKFRKCGTYFDLYKFGAPGDPTRNICWSCYPPTYAPATKRNLSGSWSELDALEDRCVNDWKE